MRVYINEELQKDILNITMLRDLWSDLKIDCRRENQILGIQIDGKFYDGLPVGLTDTEIERVDISLKSPIEVVIEGLIEGVEYLPTLQVALSQSGILFQEENIGDALKLFEQSLEGLTWLNQLLSAIDIYIFQNEQFGLNGQTYQEDINRFISILKELKIAWENQDYILISDLVEYELVPNVKGWHTHFVQILDQLSGE